MTFLVQSDLGNVQDANSYMTVAEFKSFHDARGKDYSALSDEDIEKALVRATDYIDQRFSYIGRKVYGREQSTEWPRLDAVDSSNYLIKGVPVEIKKACAVYALIASAEPLNPAPTRDPSGRIVQSKSEKVGPISESTTYAISGGGSSMFVSPRYPEADDILFRSGLVPRSGQIRRA